MKTFKKILALSLAAALVMTCGCNGSNPGQDPDEPGNGQTALGKEKIEGSSLYVKKVENLSDDFILGMDASSVIAEEKSGVKYYNFAGEEQDVFKTLAENGVNHIRVRLWVDPYDKDGNGYGGGNCDTDNAVEIGKRATLYGMKLIVDFHYSDFWADPGKQMVPKEWEGMEIEEKTDVVYQYSKDVLTRLKEEGIEVGMVQVGNETNGSMCGEKKWFNIQYLMQAGARATREVYPEALVAVHFANPEKAGSYADYASKLDYYQVDYDVFASSYYPYWHGTLENLSTVLSDIATQYNKKVMVMETSYAYTAEDTDFNGNTIGEGGGIVKNYPFSVQGQANSVRAITDTIANNTTNGIGVVYWEGTWISVGTNSWEENNEKWETYGSGWASSYAASYDPDDAGKYFGGCAVDNQAMFDAEGKPLESLRIFNLMHFGNDVELQPDALEDAQITVDLNGTIELPETVNAIMTDDSRQPVPVEWNITDAMLDTMYKGGTAKYTIEGIADGKPVNCYVSMQAFNFLVNDSFEEGDLTGWKLTELGNADELYVEDKVTDSLTGNKHMHFWGAANDSVEFTLEQTPENLEPGFYKYSISIMGGDAGNTEIYSYVKINGEITDKQPMQITSYGNWDTAVIDKIEVGEGETLTVGIYVKCSGEGNGAWGKIDDAALNSLAVV